MRYKWIFRRWKINFGVINYKSNETIEFYLISKSLEIILQINIYVKQKNKFKIIYT